MTDTSKIEKAQAAREARNHLVATSAFGSDRVGEALRRYLGAEHYRDLKDTREDAGKDAGPGTADDESADR